jgi:hypothetical protein
MGQPRRLEPSIQFNICLPMTFKDGNASHRFREDRRVDAGLGEWRVRNRTKKAGQGCQSFGLAGPLADLPACIDGPKKCQKPGQRFRDAESRPQALGGCDERRSFSVVTSGRGLIKKRGSVANGFHEDIPLQHIQRAENGSRSEARLAA